MQNEKMTTTTRKRRAETQQEAFPMTTPAIHVEKMETKQKRKVATQIFIMYYDANKAETGIKGFDFKSDLDQWLSENEVEVLRVIRGVEKKIKTVHKFTFA